MMKACIRTGIIAAAMTILFTVTAFAGGDITLQLDGRTVKTDVAPIIENSRVLVPYRALLESMGAEVYWESGASMATAILGNHRVQVTINSNTAFVDGVIKELDVPPRIVGDRTMIPLRFVLENLKCIVDWDNDRRLVSIISPKEDDSTEVNEICYEETDSSYRIIARGIGAIKSTRTFSYNDPERYGIDIHNAFYLDKVGIIEAENDIFESIRFSQFDESTVRIVVDLKEKKAGKLSLSDDKSTLYIDFERSDNGIDTDTDESEPGDKPMLPELDWRGSGKLIAIDVGHGGRDPGASGKIDGKTVINEKDLNLDIALRLYDLLEQAGVNAILLRDEDIDMSLYSRPEAANELGADLFISIHNNSAEVSTPNGSEVLYYDKVGIEDYGITSKKLAEFINAELIMEVGLKDRGIKNSPHLAVLNKSLMPAVIIEGGFLSNQGDLQVMLTEQYKDAYAVATARGIINALNYWVDIPLR